MELLQKVWRSIAINYNTSACNCSATNEVRVSKKNTVSYCVVYKKKVVLILKFYGVNEQEI